MDYELLGIVIFMAGMAATAVIGWLTGLYQFDGTRYRTRLLYGLWLLAFMSPASFLMYGIDVGARSVFAAVLLGVLMAGLISRRHTGWVRQRLHQHVLWFEPKDVGRRRWVLSFVVVVAGNAAVRYMQPDLMTYAFVALITSWLLSTLYQIVWITALEHRLGCKVIEHRRFPCGE
jgi:hypothetical protein